MCMRIIPLQDGEKQKKKKTKAAKKPKKKEKTKKKVSKQIIIIDHIAVLDKIRYNYVIRTNY